MLDTQTRNRPRSRTRAAPQWHCLRSDASDEARLTVSGELDVATAPRLDRALRRAQADAAVVVLDLRRLDFMDSSGGHVMLAADRRARASGGRLAVVRGAAKFDRLLDLMGIDRGVRA
jgi:anti-sigma B factor antagonist